MKKHEYLMAEDHYEVRSVKKGRKEKVCEYCGRAIPIGAPANTHTFYPEFQAYDTHLKCSDDFEASLNTQEDIKQKEYEESTEYQLQQVRELIKE